MAYTQQTWADSPATSSPLDAARMNHMESGIFESATQHPAVSQTLSFSNGGQGSGLSSYLSVTRTVTGTNFGIRLPFHPLDDIASYTVKIRNYNAFSAANGAATLTLDGMAIGTMTAPSTGAAAQTGNFSGSTGTTLATSGAIPNTASFLSVSGSGGLTGGVDYVLGISFHAASSTTLLAGIGQCWYWSNATSAHNPATAASGATSAAQYIPLDVVIEYTTTTRKRAILVVGDSIPEGTQGIGYYTNSSATNVQPTALHMGYIEQWARRRGDIIPQRHCLFASTAQTWASGSYDGYSRMNTSGATWDGAILTLGANDLAAATTLANLKTYYTSCITNIQTIIGTAPLYAVNIMPEGWTSTTESNRLAFNDWLGQLPYGLTGCIDADKAVRGWASTGGSLATNTMDLVLSCDGIHLSRQGSTRLADTLMAAIP